MTGVLSIWVSILFIANIFLAVLFLVSAFGMAWVVFRDAQERGVSEASATLWALGFLILIPLVAPLYLLRVVRSNTRTTVLPTRDLWFIWVFCSVLFATVVGNAVTPPDPFTQLIATLVLLPVFALGLYVGYRKLRANSRLEPPSLPPTG